MADYPSVCLSCWDSIPRPYRRAPGRPFAPDRELLEPEPGAWILVPSTAGYAAPLAGNDGYPRCGGRTRLVTTPEIARVPFSGFNLHVPAGIAYLYLYMSCTGPTPDISSRLVVVHLQINPASTLFVALANLLRVSQAAPPSSTSPCRELCLLFFSFPSPTVPISPFSIVGSRSLLFVPRRPHFASPLEAALLHSSSSNQTPSIPPSRLAPRPGLASPHLLSPRIACQAAVITGQATGLASHSQSPASSLRLPAVRHPLTGRLAVSLRASSASITDNPPLALDSFAVQKPWQLPRDPFELVQASLLQQLAALLIPGEAACSVNRHI